MAKAQKNTHVSNNNKREKEKKSASDTSCAPRRPIWEVIVEIGSQIPEEEWAKVPADASVNLKHYLYGASKHNV